jgi:hypothetical protein
MESVELKLRLIDDVHFPVNYTKKIVEILHDPELSIEVKDGQITEDVTRLIGSLGYDLVSKKDMGGWNLLKAVKVKK